jgi:phosphoribosyl 1,2-cyclic phosphodiesterase
MRFCVLGSSSSGNSTLVHEGDTSILIDAGLPVRYTIDKIMEITGRMSLDGIFVSHEHSDHTRNLFALAKRLQCPVYLSSPVSWYLGKREDVEIIELRDRWSFELGCLRITPFIVSHDAIDPFGFIVEGEYGSMGLVTDLGCFDENTMDILRDREGLVIESNYDLDMLVNGRYPNYLKKRIQNGKGHLSNQQCRDLLKEIIGPKTTDIVLAHLSEENNDPLLAIETSMEAIGEKGPNLHVSYPKHPTEIMDLSRGRI